jgi:hypothetical protein
MEYRREGPGGARARGTMRSDMPAEKKGKKKACVLMRWQQRPRHYLLAMGGFKLGYGSVEVIERGPVQTHIRDRS